jgi:tetratricopeptide (TPR) repeat protein
LSQAIQLYPALAVAYFNRAIVLEKKFDYLHAVDDWKQYLALDPRSPWAGEARARLADLQRKMHLDGREDTGRLNELVEYRLETALSSGFADLPGCSALGLRLTLENGDNWLTDALVFHRDAAVAVLATMVDSRSALQVSQFPAELEQLRKLDSPALPPPLKVWLAFESIFRATHSPGVAIEPAGLNGVVQLAQTRGYRWLLGQILLERSTSRIYQGRWEVATALQNQVTQLAKDYHFPLLEMRASGFLAIQFAQSGRHGEAAQIESDELKLFWERPTPWLRGEVYYAGMAWSEEALHAAMLSADAAARTAALAGAPETEAVNLARAAGFAQSAGNWTQAAPLLKSSQAIFSSLPWNTNTEDYRIFAQSEYALNSTETDAAAQIEAYSRNSLNPIVKAP